MTAVAVHALWAFALQATLVVLAGTGAALALRWRDDPRARLLLWRMVLGACLLLPVIAWVRPAAAPETVEPAVTLDAIVTGLARTTTGGPPGAGHAPALVLLVLAGGAILSLTRLAHAARALRRFAARPELRLELFDDLQRALDTRARLVAGPIHQPFTFGRRAPTVVVPERFLDEPAPVQRAVLAHELVHVRRGDWLHASLEEICCALLWFHPAVWWVIRELRLAREEIVDREAARAAGSRRAYLTTLLEFAARRDGHLGRSVAFFRHRQLARRVAALSKEVSMSTRLLVLSGAAAAVLLTAAAHAAQAAFPVAAPQHRPAADSGGASEASALERQAYQLPKGAQPPRKVHDVRFAYPDDIKTVITSALFAVRIVIDTDGSVAAARILNRKVGGPDAPTDVLAEAVARLSAGTLATVRQWRFEPPAKGPLAMTVTVSYEGDGEKRSAPPPPPPPPAPGDGTVTRPVPIAQPNAVYPEDAKKAGVQGVVRLSVTVGRDGLVKDARVIQSVPALDRAALDAVRQWTFRPGTRNGAPVDVVTEITISFTLRE